MTAALLAIGAIMSAMLTLGPQLLGTQVGDVRHGATISGVYSLHSQDWSAELGRWQREHGLIEGGGGNESNDGKIPYFRELIINNDNSFSMIRRFGEKETQRSGTWIMKERTLELSWSAMDEPGMWSEAWRVKDDGSIERVRIDGRDPAGVTLVLRR